MSTTAKKSLTKYPDIGGYPERWPSGSIFENEGKRLYDLVRKYKPNKIVEVGTRWGCSTQWLAAACRDNGKGHVDTYDIENLHQPWPEDLSPYITFIQHSIFDEPVSECDMLFEDGAHTTGFTSGVLLQIKAKVIVIHDYMHFGCVETVHEEALETLGEPTEVFFEDPSDCGLAIYVYR